MPEPVRPPRTSVLLLSGAFTDEGGIQAYSRLLLKSFGELGTTEALLLRDSVVDIEPSYRGGAQVSCFRGSTVRFALGALRRALADRPALFVFGHVHFAPLALIIRAIRPGIPQWFVVYGMEVWSRLPLLRRLALRSAARVVSISDHTSREMVDANGIDPARVSLLPCALDPVWTSKVEQRAAAAAATRVARPVLLTVGRLELSEGAKGVDRVIRAIPLIAARIPEVRYIVVGRGTALPWLSTLAESVGVAAQVEFRGRVNQQQLAEAYTEASLFVMPSRLEGFGIAFIEAALFGLPSLAASAGGAPEVVLDGVTGVLVGPDDVAGIAERVVELFSNPGTLLAQGARASVLAKDRYGYDGFRRRVAALMGESALP